MANEWWEYAMVLVLVSAVSLLVVQVVGWMAGWVMP
jgi:hypothetical protein